jgi:SCY1-like protein 1
VWFTRRTLNESAASFPPEFASHRVLPSLISALEFGGASASTILPLVLQLGKNVSPEDYSSIVLAPLIKLYTSPDRGTRMALLDHLPEYADKLDKKSVVDKIWPNLVSVSYGLFELTLTLATFCAHSKQDFRIRWL